jgi:hypothetical protein
MGCQPTGPSLIGDSVSMPASQRAALQSAFAATVGDGPNGAHIIFLNYDGVTVSPNGENSALNQSFIAQSTTTMPPFDASPYAGQFTADQAKTAITNYVKQFYAPFNAVIVTTRPPSTQRYTMCIIGGTPDALGKFIRAEYDKWGRVVHEHGIKDTQ